MTLSRLFIPSWRFFDQLGTIATLYYRTNTNSTWQIVLKKPTRQWWHLFHNPHGNQYLMCLSLVDRLITEKADQSIEQTESFQLVRNLVKSVVQEENQQNKTFEFKIELRQPDRSSQLFLQSGTQEI